MTGLALACVLLLPGHMSVMAADSTVADSLLSPVDIEPPESDRYFEMVQSESGNLLLLDDLLWLQEHPYDLNTVTETELESIPGVTPHEAAEVIRHRKEIKRFTTVQQLQDVDESGDELYVKLAPYVVVRRQAPFVQVRSRTGRDLQPRRGYRDGTFLGSSLKSYGRISIEAGDFQMGGVAEKDGGERVENGFVSGYVEARNMGPLSQVVAGDFTVEAGQGLVFWRGSSFGKGSESVSIAKKSGTGVQPCRSTDEFNYFRGVAASTSFGTGEGSLHLTAFFSGRLLDGSLDSSRQVTSLYDAGLFQTQNDLMKRNTVTERVAGGRIELIGSGGWRIGSTGYHSVFDKQLASDRMYEFAGRTQDILGLDASVTAGKASLFGEIAGSGERGVAGIIGTILSIGPGSDVAVVYRDYGPAYNNLHASGFGEHANVKNERGFYVATKIQALRWLLCSAYVDQFRFPWRTYFDPLPTTGHELFVETVAAVSSRLDLGARFSDKSTGGSETNLDRYGRETRIMADRDQEKYRFTVSYKASPRLSVKGRMEFTEVGYRQSGRRETGYLLFQDIRYAVAARFSVEGRLVFFQTDSYDSRVYDYENDLRGVFSNPGLYGKGRRWYAVVRYSPATMVTLSAKYSEMQKEGVTSIGSGPDEITGDIENRLALQIDLRL